MLPCSKSLTALASKSRFRPCSSSNAAFTASSSFSIFAFVSTASRLFPSRRLSRAFHSFGVQDSFVPNCAIVRFNVMRPMMGALPDLSGSVFFR